MIRINKDILLLPRFFIEGEYQYISDFGWINDLGYNKKNTDETERVIGLLIFYPVTFLCRVTIIIDMAGGRINNKAFIF